MEEERTRLKNDAATKRLRLAMEPDKERKARLEKMVATNGSSWPWRWTKKEKQDWRNGTYRRAHVGLIKGVVNVGVVFIPQTLSQCFR